jgi:Caspase domain
MRRLCTVTIAISFCWLFCQPALAEKRVALVIGNSAYANVPRLTNPGNDARLIAQTLRSLGFDLVGDGAQLDLNESSFRRVVQNFGVQLQGADVGLFYYAGHGVQIRGSNYLVPIDANPTREADADFQMLDANLVLLQMEGANTKLNVVILDACRNNPLAGRALRSVASGLATMHSPEGTLISFATQPGNVAQDGSDGHSPYTDALAKTIVKPGLDIFRTFNEVGLAVAAATGGSQEPWVSHSPIKGDFYFVEAPASGTFVPGVQENPSSTSSAPPADQASRPSDKKAKESKLEMPSGNEKTKSKLTDGVSKSRSAQAITACRHAEAARFTRHGLEGDPAKINAELAFVDRKCGECVGPTCHRTKAY